MAFLLKLYLPFYKLFGGNELLLSTAGIFLLLNVPFWLLALIMMRFDSTAKPKWIHKYKVQQDKNSPVDPAKLKDAINVAIYNMFILTPIILIGLYVIQKYFSLQFETDPEAAPSVPTALVQIAFSALVSEVYFYYSHRLIHHPKLYGPIHKMHHTWTAPMAVAAVYATPTEYLLSNIMTGLLGPLILGCHLSTVGLWCVIIMFATCMRHSGYHFPFMPSPQFHDYHHLTFNWNFGHSGLMDWLHGTDGQFRKSIQSKRHCYHRWPGHPMQERFPDEQKN